MELHSPQTNTNSSTWPGNRRSSTWKRGCGSPPSRRRLHYECKPLSGLSLLEESEKFETLTGSGAFNRPPFPPHIPAILAVIFFFFFFLFFSFSGYPISSIILIFPVVSSSLNQLITILYSWRYLGIVEGSLKAVYRRVFNLFI